MRVAQLWRYPVKSMQGESLATLDVGNDRIPGDREWGVRNSASGEVLTARAARPLLHAKARRHGHDDVTVTLPDGRELRDGHEHTDLALSAYLGMPVHLARAKPDESGAFQSESEFSDPGRIVRWRSVPGTFNDGAAVHVLTTASLRAAAGLHPSGDWDVRRFRPNVLVDVDDDGFVEDGWREVHLGDVVLEVFKPTSRCAITSRAQPGIDDDADIPRTLARNRNTKLGVYAHVRVAGTIAVGANVRLA